MSPRLRLASIYAALAVLTVWCGACSKTAGPPRVQVMPVAAAVSVAAGSPVQVAVQVTLPEGFHVNANTPRDPSLIPLVLTVELQAGVTVTEIRYPTPIDLEQHGAREPLAVYQREFRIGVVLSVAEDVAPGEIVVPARLRYQACDERMCYVPATAATKWTVRVLPAGAAGGSSPRRAVLVGARKISGVLMRIRPPARRSSPDSQRSRRSPPRGCRRSTSPARTDERPPG